MRQAVILAAGRGSRMSRLDRTAELDHEQRAVADVGGKGLMPFGGRPFLDFVLRELAEVGIERAVLVVAPGDDALRERYAPADGDAASGIKLSCVVQKEALGTADAVLLCRQALAEEPFLSINSDNFYPAAALALLAGESGMACLGLDLAALSASGRTNLSQARLSAWAALQVDALGLLIRILEKPTAEELVDLEPPHLASPNAWRLTPDIFDACRRVTPSVRGEYELPAAVQYAIDTMSCRVRVVATDAPVLDLSTRADVASVARLLPPWLPARTCRDRMAGRIISLDAWVATVQLEEERAAVRSLVMNVVSELRRRSRARPAVYFVPGRIELLGKHTDYAGGRSLTCAVEPGICLGATPRADRDLVLADLVRRAEIRLPLDDRGRLDDPGRFDDWRRYAAALIGRLDADFRPQPNGTEIVLASDLPSAAGMSSSSALVVALFLGLASVNERLADLCRTSLRDSSALANYLAAVESGGATQESGLPATPGVGTFGGSEDHTAILCSEPSELRSYSYAPVVAEEAVSLPPELTFAVAVSGVHASKAGAARGAYNRLAGRAAAAAEVWRVESGAGHPHLAAAVRSVGAGPVRSAIGRGRHDDYATAELLDRFDQFVEESEVLVPEAMAALRRNDLPRFGSLVERSQELAEEKLGNQVPETAFLARSARAAGALAASAFGAGFGGSVWALVETGDVDRFVDHWRSTYTDAFPLRADARFLKTRPAGPARRILL